MTMRSGHWFLTLFDNFAFFWQWHFSNRSFNNEAGPSMFCQFEDDENFEEFYNLVKCWYWYCLTDDEILRLFSKFGKLHDDDDDDDDGGSGMWLLWCGLPNPKAVIIYYKLWVGNGYYASFSWKWILCQFNVINWFNRRATPSNWKTLSLFLMRRLWWRDDWYYESNSFT